MLQIETEKPITINRMDLIEQALRCPNFDAENPQEVFTNMRETMDFVSGLGADHAKKVLEISHDTMLDILIARRRVTGRPTTVVKMHKRIDESLQDHAINYSANLFLHLSKECSPYRSRVAMLIAGEITDRLKEYKKSIYV